MLNFITEFYFLINLEEREREREREIFFLELNLVEHKKFLFIIYIKLDFIKKN